MAGFPSYQSYNGVEARCKETRARDLDSKAAAWNKFGGKMASRNRVGSPYHG